MKNKLLKRANGGFSLVELIVVIAIMAILVGVAVPVYSSYIEKSQKAKDEQMIDEIKHAIEIYYASNSDADLSSGDYVVLTLNGAETSDANSFIAQALKETFGESWDDDLCLSYGGWTSAAAMLDWANNNPYAGSVQGSTYFDTVGTEGLLGDVQHCASSLAALLVGKGFSGEECANILVNKIYGTNNKTYNGTILDGMNGSDMNADVLANATVFVIAEALKQDGTAQETITNFGEDGYLSDALDRSLEDNHLSASDVVLTDFANTYAALEAFVNYALSDNETDDDATIRASWNGLNDTISGGDVNAIVSGLDDASSTIMLAAGETGAYEAYYSSGQAQKDGEAYVATMQAVDGLKTEFKPSLDQEGLFSSANVSDKVNSYVAASSMTFPNGVTGSAVIILFSLDSNGNPIIQIAA